MESYQRGTCWDVPQLDPGGFLGLPHHVSLVSSYWDRLRQCHCAVAECHLLVDSQCRTSASPPWLLQPSVALTVDDPTLPSALSVPSQFSCSVFHPILSSGLPHRSDLVLHSSARSLSLVWLCLWSKGCVRGLPSRTLAAGHRSRRPTLLLLLLRVVLVVLAFRPPARQKPSGLSLKAVSVVLLLLVLCPCVLVFHYTCSPSCKWKDFHKEACLDFD